MKKRLSTQTRVTPVVYYMYARRPKNLGCLTFTMFHDKPIATYEADGDIYYKIRDVLLSLGYHKATPIMVKLMRANSSLLYALPNPGTKNARCFYGNRKLLELLAGKAMYAHRSCTHVGQWSELFEHLDNKDKKELPLFTKKKQEVTMCKFNGKEIRTRQGENGETLYRFDDVVKAIGYSYFSNLASRTCKSLPASTYQTTPAKASNCRRFWLNRSGLDALAAKNAQAPAKCNHTTEWGKFLRFLDSGADVFESFPENAEPASSLFPKIDSLIEEYQKFKKEYESMQQELQRLQHENRKLKQLRIDVEKVLASGF